jgi:hypothetical protein
VTTKLRTPAASRCQGRRDDPGDVQSVTAVNRLGGVAHLALPQPYRTAFAAFGVVYGVPVLGFAALWAAALTVRAARQELPFSLTWWSFTFPVGTCVTATSGLALHIGADAFRWAAVALYLALVAAWAVVSVHTVRGAWRGRLFLATPPQAETAQTGTARADTAQTATASVVGRWRQGARQAP